jgi:hypothetical protein
MGQGASNLGKKISDGAGWLGKKMGEGWQHVKAFGKSTYDKIKSVPVLGQIAQGIEKYTPIGMAASNLIKGVDAGIGASSKLLQGDVKGAVQTGINFGRESLNQKSALLEAAKKVPVLGKIAGAAETVANRVPIYGGMSMNDMRNIGNAALNSTEALKNGDYKGALKEGLKAGGSYIGSKTGGSAVVGKALTTAGNVI